MTVRHIALHGAVDSVDSHTGAYAAYAAGIAAGIGIEPDRVLSCRSDRAAGRSKCRITDIRAHSAIDIIDGDRAGHTSAQTGNASGCDAGGHSRFISCSQLLIAAACNFTICNYGFCVRIILQHAYG